MANINKCRYSVDEVIEYIRTSSNDNYDRNSIDVINVNSTSFNNGTSADYPYCHNIKHPETGETLTPVRGYMGADEKGTDRCYYAEYRDNKGNTYSYNYQYAVYDAGGRQLCPAKDIATQQYEDNSNAKVNIETNVQDNAGESIDEGEDNGQSM